MLYFFLEKMSKMNVKDKLQDETLDLSLCDLEEVPVREIVSSTKFFFLFIFISSSKINLVKLLKNLKYLKNKFKV